MAIALRVTITGQVQGVFFRAWAKKQAEALVSGDPNAVEQMIERMRRGPPSAVVERLTEEPSDEPAGEGFVVRH